MRKGIPSRALHVIPLLRIMSSYMPRPPSLGGLPSAPIQSLGVTFGSPPMWHPTAKSFKSVFVLAVLWEAKASDAFLVLFGPCFWLFSQKITFLIQAFLFHGPY